VSTTERGRAAEAATAEYLIGQEYAILARNWRTRWHEVDIVAQNRDGLHFIEVKYRQNNRYGSGFDYISRDKLARLQRAALYWAQINHYDGDYRIDAVSVSGSLDRLMVEMIENVSLT
jgi:putative endonuclease